MPSTLTTALVLLVVGAIVTIVALSLVYPLWNLLNPPESIGVDGNYYAYMTYRAECFDPLCRLRVYVPAYAVSIELSSHTRTRVMLKVFYQLGSTTADINPIEYPGMYEIIGGEGYNIENGWIRFEPGGWLRLRVFLENQPYHVYLCNGQICVELTGYAGRKLPSANTSSAKLFTPVGGASINLPRTVEVYYYEVSHDPYECVVRELPGGTLYPVYTGKPCTLCEPVKTGCNPVCESLGNISECREQPCPYGVCNPPIGFREAPLVYLGLAVAWYGSDWNQFKYSVSRDEVTVADGVYYLRPVEVEGEAWLPTLWEQRYRGGATQCYRPVLGLKYSLNMSQDYWAGWYFYISVKFTDLFYGIHHILAWTESRNTLGEIVEAEKEILVAGENETGIYGVRLGYSTQGYTYIDYNKYPLRFKRYTDETYYYPQNPCFDQLPYIPAYCYGCECKASYGNPIPTPDKFGGAWYTMIVPSYLISH